jgi:hypothetical protein
MLVKSSKKYFVWCKVLGCGHSQIKGPRDEVVLHTQSHILGMSLTCEFNL